MFETPQEAHHWLKPLEGVWLSEMECQMGPDQPAMKTTGEVTCRSLGGMWYLIEGGGEDADTGAWSTLMTLGYDVAQGLYVGSFVGSMMSCLWSYQGALDKSGRKLTLDTMGPKCGSEGMASYKDAIEIIDETQWVLTSEILTETGDWVQIMRSEHRRKN